MGVTRRLPASVVAALDAGKILGIRAGREPHRFIGVWVVVVEGRVFVRSWGLKARGWHRTFLDDPHGTIEVNGRQLPVRAALTKSERLLAAVDRAYAAKYRTPAARKYVLGFARPKRRATTTELKPERGGPA